MDSDTMPGFGGKLAKTLRKGAGAVAARAQNRVKPDLTSRDSLILSSQQAALTDSRFLAYVAQGDSLRDQQRWQEAEAAYAAALSIHPWERTYWVQRGHMAKEQQNFAGAEVAYRTACALGAAPPLFMEHLRFVMAQQHADLGVWPIHPYRAGPAARQAPAQPDVDILARLLWRVGGLSQEDMLRLLRTSSSCDELVATMCADPRFERANRDWLELVEEGEL